MAQIQVSPPPSARLSRRTHVSYRSALLCSVVWLVYTCLPLSSPMFGLAGASQSPRTHFPAFSIPHPHPALRRYGNLCHLVDVNRLTPATCLVQFFLPSPFRSLINTGYVRSPLPHLRMFILTSKKRVRQDLALLNDLARLLSPC